MVTLYDLMSFLNDFMGDVGDKDPYMPNGLQVRGKEEIKLLATGVSASLRLFQEGVARGHLRGCGNALTATLCLSRKGAER
jgi:hypothetical protein